MANQLLSKLGNIDNAKKIAIVAIVIVVIWVLVEFGGDFQSAITSILTTLGLKKPAVVAAAESTIQATATTSSNPSSPWSPTLYANNPDASTLDFPTLTNISDTIYATVSFFPTWLIDANGAGGLAAMKQLNNQVDVSNLVQVFQQSYNKDLYTFFESNYTSQINEVVLTQIITFVNALPAT